MKITKGRLKQIIKEEVGSFSSELSEGSPSLEDVKGIMASVAQGLLQEPPSLPAKEEVESLYNGLMSIIPSEEVPPEEDVLGDLGAVNE
jgi:hypothetical protein